MTVSQLNDKSKYVRPGKNLKACSGRTSSWLCFRSRIFRAGVSSNAVHGTERSLFPCSRSSVKFLKPSRAFELITVMSLKFSHRFSSAGVVLKAAWGISVKWDFSIRILVTLSGRFCGMAPNALSSIHMSDLWWKGTELNVYLHQGQILQKHTFIFYAFTWTLINSLYTKLWAQIYYAFIQSLITGSGSVFINFYNIRLWRNISRNDHICGSHMHLPHLQVLQTFFAEQTRTISQFEDFSSSFFSFIWPPWLNLKCIFQNMYKNIKFWNISNFEGEKSSNFKVKECNLEGFYCSQISKPKYFKLLRPKYLPNLTLWYQVHNNHISTDNRGTYKRQYSHTHLIHKQFLQHHPPSYKHSMFSASVKTRLSKQFLPSVTVVHTAASTQTLSKGFIRLID